MPWLLYPALFVRPLPNMVWRLLIPNGGFDGGNFSSFLAWYWFVMCILSTRGGQMVILLDQRTIILDLSLL